MRRCRCLVFETVFVKFSRRIKDLDARHADALRRSCELGDGIDFLEWLRSFGPRVEDDLAGRGAAFEQAIGSCGLGERQHGADLNLDTPCQHVADQQLQRRDRPSRAMREPAAEIEGDDRLVLAAGGLQLGWRRSGETIDDRTAEGREAVQAVVEHRAAGHFEDDVHAATSRQPAHLVAPVRAGVVDRMVKARFSGVLAAPMTVPAPSNLASWTA